MGVKSTLDGRKAAPDGAHLSTDFPTAAPPVESFLRHHAPKLGRLPKNLQRFSENLQRFLEQVGVFQFDCPTLFAVPTASNHVSGLFHNVQQLISSRGVRGACALVW